jgi:fatty acid desaturase
MAAGYAYLWFWHSICPLWQQLLCWVVIGTGYFGVFQTAVDCAHFAFWPQRPLMQDALGAVLMAPALMSYEVFRLKYFNHLM